MSSVSRFALNAGPQWPDAAEGTDGLWELAYYSEASGPIEVQRLEALMRDAGDRNRASGVTGILLYWDQSFFQVLEGAVRDIRAIYQGFIVPASSHKSLFVCHLGPLAARSFPDWSMAVRTVARDSSIADLHDTIDALGARPPAVGRRSAGRVLLGSFVRNMRADWEPDAAIR
ncbi:MAG: BLUF domain-containing protein [Sneathiellaceae bacterium]